MSFAMDKLLKLYDELEDAYCPYEDRDNYIDWCEVCKNSTDGYYEICTRINKRIEDVKRRMF